MHNQLYKLIVSKKFSDVLYEWLEYKKISIKKSSYFKYQNQIDINIIPYFNNIDFRKLNVNHILNFFNRNDIKTLSNSTKNNILIIIKSAIDYGIKMKYRKNFDAINIKFNTKTNEITYFSKKEQEIITNYINKNMNLNNLAILFALFTGVRIGELCSLKGSDIDFTNNTVIINKTVQRIKNTIDNTSKTKLIVDTPKTKSSIRIIPIPLFLIELLKYYITNENNYIFTCSNIPKDPRTLEKYFSNLLTKIGIKKINFHALRHSYATRLMEQKVNIKIISELLGHSDWKITESIYVHASFEHKKTSIDVLNDLWHSDTFVEVV